MQKLDNLKVWISKMISSLTDELEVCKEALPGASDTARKSYIE